MQEDHPFFGQPKEEFEQKDFHGDFQAMHQGFMNKIRHFVEEFKKRQGQNEHEETAMPEKMPEAVESEIAIESAP